ncbi:tumor suppressor protein Gltscr2 [Dentipellis sp. KUC8613]|nr:tumor suppressor protein Gltscr2 [Dentipellis sp. KUC8613]
MSTKSSKDSKKPKSAPSAVGAPAQHKQASRKGKKAWRKNVDLEDMEETLEEIRGEERLFGTALHHKKDEDLFVVDSKGDEKLRNALPKFSTSRLTSHKILAQRSAIPAVVSRPTSSGKKRSAVHVSSTDKDRLLRIGKKARRGPLNSIVDHDQFGEGSAVMEVTEAVKQSGKYDVWSGEVEVEGVKVKAPNVPHPRNAIAIPAITTPHAGASYNPDVAAHTELLRTAHELEEQRLKESMKGQDVKERVLAARRTEADIASGGVDGMIIDKPGEGVEEDEEDEAGEEVAKPKMPGRKTKQQRRKAEKLRAEKRALAERALRKRLLASVDSVKTLRKSTDATLAARAQAVAERRARLQQQLQKGLAGKRLGKHRVQEGELDVQLGEDLSESLRGLRPEGNLFRDRFVSMQQRALIEPRVPVVPKKKRAQTKEVEKHAWKRFE